jgi:quinol monooxygenase YgiN
MILSRRFFTLGGLMSVAVRAAGEENKGMYGLIGQILTATENRDAVIDALRDGSKSMPGCVSYVVAKDAARDDAIWVTEVWTDKQSHQNSLGLPQVQQAIAKARPMIIGFGTRVETIPFTS